MQSFWHRIFFICKYTQRVTAMRFQPRYILWRSSTPRCTSVAGTWPARLSEPLCFHFIVLREVKFILKKNLWKYKTFPQFSGIQLEKYNINLWMLRKIKGRQIKVFCANFTTRGKGFIGIPTLIDKPCPLQYPTWASPDIS